MRKYNNNGFTLLELTVSIAILAAVFYLATAPMLAISDGSYWGMKDLSVLEHHVGSAHFINRFLQDSSYEKQYLRIWDYTTTLPSDFFTNENRTLDPTVTNVTGSSRIPYRLFFKSARAFNVSTQGTVDMVLSNWYEFRMDSQKLILREWPVADPSLDNNGTQKDKVLILRGLNYLGFRYGFDKRIEVFFETQSVYKGNKSVFTQQIIVYPKNSFK